ncbi:hypothetical protein EDD15DRAFT_897434 [Pisolithus albus]|nr:hypothetical protein EDD15DRAFT_897434 [Pisolithus albus]
MDVREALQVLHSVDWVYRDISTGKVLRRGEMGKSADLECAKRMDSNTAHEVLTGTLEFMACEVEAQNYLFQPRGGKRRREGEPCGEDSNLPFRFNPLHDMESLWWIATWTLYYHVDQKGGRPSSEQITQFHKLFPGRLDSASRTNAFLVPLKCKVLPASFHRAGYEVEFMHQEIMAAYTESEKSMPTTYTNPLEKLHSDFTDCLAFAFAASKNIEIFSPNAKQQREDPPSDTQDPEQPSNEKQETDTSNKKPKRDDSREPSNGGYQ